MSIVTSFMDLRPGFVIMLLIGCLIVPLAKISIDKFTGGIARILVEMFTELYSTGMVVVAGVAPALCTVRAATVLDTNEPIFTRVEVVGDGASSDIDFPADANARIAVIAVVICTTLLELLKDFMLFCWTEFCCWPIAISDCCALQAWMPSCHVC